MRMVCKTRNNRALAAKNVVTEGPFRGGAEFTTLPIRAAPSRCTKDDFEHFFAKPLHISFFFTTFANANLLNATKG